MQLECARRAKPAIPTLQRRACAKKREALQGLHSRAGLPSPALRTVDEKTTRDGTMVPGKWAERGERKISVVAKRTLSNIWHPTRTAFFKPVFEPLQLVIRSTAAAGDARPRRPKSPEGPGIAATRASVTKPGPAMGLMPSVGAAHYRTGCPVPRSYIHLTRPSGVRAQRPGQHL